MVDLQIVPDAVAEFRGISKSYPIYRKPVDRLRELLTFNRFSFHQDFWALRDITFDVRRGETFCIIGENGSGKSTLLQILAGILAPTSGDLNVKGRVAALLELGSGFNPEFSGRDNVYLNASILGLSRREIDARYPSIEQFAEIGSFIDQPVKTYSSGMAVRLAFAVAIHVDPEILLVDEALAVGDIYFRQRCMRKVHELRSQGVTIVFVSHSMGDVKAIGDRTMWLDRGQVCELGVTDQVVTKYLGAMAEKDTSYLELKEPVRRTVESVSNQAPEIVSTIPNVDHRHGDGRAEVIGVAILNEDGHRQPYLQSDSRVIVRISVRAKDRIANPNVGFMMRNHLGVDFAGTNTLREGIELAPMIPGDTTTVDFHVDIPTLYPAHFSFSPAIADGNLHHYKMCDWIDNAITLQMGAPDQPIYGYIHLPCRVEVNARLHRTEDQPAEAKRLG
ncbi:MAG: ABC transporter ATP-binding protein [Bryobacterales bacterium]|nr:ABC transporter ATP-binding protein [Bryobacterales bacterium]